MRQHRDLMVRYAYHEDAELWYNSSKVDDPARWVRLIDMPRWHEDAHYVVLVGRKEKEMWQAWREGTLAKKIGEVYYPVAGKPCPSRDYVWGGEWDGDRYIPEEYMDAWGWWKDGTLYVRGADGAYYFQKDKPKFLCEVGAYKRSRHWELIKGCTMEDVIWVNTGCGWTKVLGPCSWYESDRYKVIGSVYAEAWAAYLEGEMEFFDEGTWRTWLTAEPMFNNGPDCYRRKLGWTVERVNGMSEDAAFKAIGKEAEK